MNKILEAFTKEYKEETEYREIMKENTDKFKLGLRDIKRIEKEAYNQALEDFVKKSEEKIKEICLKAEDDIPFLDIFDIKKIEEQLKK